jgi:hypothetical protein
MASYTSQLGDLPSKLASSKRVLIALSKDLSVDSLASALAMALSLQKAGKTVSVVSEGKALISHSHLYGVGDVRNAVPTSGEGNFVVKLEGVVDPSGQMNTVPSLEKLDWYPEGSALNLVFHVVPGQRFEPTNVSYAHETSGFDLIITVDADSLDDLGQIYLRNAALFSKSTILNIDNDSVNSQFGNINIVDSQASSISEMTLTVLKNLNLEMDSDIASNLLAGIYDATANLTQRVSPDTFVAVAAAMQSGGKLPEGGVANSMQSDQSSVESSQPSAIQAEQVVETPSSPIVEVDQPVQPATNQIQFGNQPSAGSANSSQAVSAPQTAVPAPEASTAPQLVSDAAPAAPANDLYSNPFLNPSGQTFSGMAFNPAADQSSASSASQGTNDPFAAPASGPTFNFGSFGGDSQPSAVSSQPSASPVPQEPVPAAQQPEQVDVSGPLTTIMQAKQKDEAYDLKQIFNVEQMPETPTSANTTLDSAVQRVQNTIDNQQPLAAQAILQQQSAGQTQSALQPQPVDQPVQESKPQSSPEERPAGEATTSTNPEAEANPTPDWLVPKIFKGGSLG